MKKLTLSTYILFSCIAPALGEKKLLPTEKIATSKVWVSPAIPSKRSKYIPIVVWFDQQFLGDGKAYNRRAKELNHLGRRELRSRVVATLKKLSETSFNAAKRDLTALEKKGEIKGLKQHWIINGFKCQATPDAIQELKKVTGVSKIFLTSPPSPANQKTQKKTAIPRPDRPTKISTKNLPWYISKLKADRVWEEFGITGEGTLNIIHDHNFIISPSLSRTVYTNPDEIPNNGKDDDNNGLIDDYHGYNFNTQSPNLQPKKITGNSKEDKPVLHGTSCANIVCGPATAKGTPQFGIAPMSRWAGIITRSDIESAIEWAIEHEADTYSMSFSRPGLGEERSHWRKLMEHGSFCGVFFVSGAGNFAQNAKVPVQMRTPEDIPEAVFAAAGVKKDLSRTPFSSKGPVKWETEHYKDGLVQKPEVCAFNYQIPLLMPDGSVSDQFINGNSFAGPMFCGSISLMLSADPDLLPWNLKTIITSTATDVAAPGIDDETGHGLINCYAAVKEVLRQKILKAKTP